jgi:hypothetical protein
VIKFCSKSRFKNQKLVLAVGNILGGTVVDTDGIDPLFGSIHVL